MRFALAVVGASLSFSGCTCTVLTQPGQTCTISNGSGTISAANVAVACVAHNAPLAASPSP
jgi:hypothetical protein